MSGDEQGPRVTLVLGGARSGKSSFAEEMAISLDREMFYIATAQPGDEEMAARIAEHQARRGAHWQTVEAPLDLPAALSTTAGPGRVALVDCLTLWLSNLMAVERDLSAETQALLATLGRPAGPVILVSNEVGLGIVPMNALARAFRDHQGRLNQQVAALADRVVLMAAGLPLTLKGG